MNEWFIDFPSFTPKRMATSCASRLKPKLFLFLGMLVCQKSWRRRVLPLRQCQMFSSSLRCRARKRKWHEGMLVNHNTVLVCRWYGGKETCTVSLATYRRGWILRQRIIKSHSQTVLALRPTQSVFWVTKWKKTPGLHWYKQVFAF